jgi:two-component sensor histidine kinase
LRAEISGHFCEQVVRSGSRLRVSYAPAERRWQNAPELEDGLVSYLGYPLRWPDGTIFGTLCILDTTRRDFGPLCDEMLQKLQELIEEDLLLIVRNRELNEALSQRELLLRELRHRIKNSLNHIYSLVSLWGMQSSSEEVHSLTEMVQKRLASIGMLYSHLEMSEGSPLIRFDHYLRGILDHIRGLYESDIRIELSAEALEITPDGAMYLGLLTAEIVTNSFKYAFPDPQEGRITLHLSRDGGHLWYRVADNGVGIEPDAMRESESSDEHMGLSLVYSIVRRLQGRVRLAGGEGTEWCFCIPLEKLQG